MKNPFFVFFLAVSLLLATPLYAEIYKYIDENGQKRWTDDLSQVPKEQRPSAQRIETEEETSAYKTLDKVKKTQPESSLGTKTAISGSGEAGETAQPSRVSLEKEKADLDTQYQQLMEERTQIEKLRTEATTFNDRANLNQRISEFNTKTGEYEAQLNAFNEKVSAYNQKIMSKKTPQSE